VPDVIGGLTGLLGSGVRDLAGGVLDSFAKWVWSGGLDLLKAGIGLADRFGTVNVDVHSGPLAAVWPVTVPIGLSIAGLLFYLQLATVTAKGGRGLLRSVSGTAQFGVALAASAVMFASLVAVSDGFTTFILRKGLSSENFAEAFSHTGFSDATANAVKAGALLLMSIFGVVPISLGFAFENVMRAATIYLLVAVIPITAAGLVAGSTESWYWRTSNWLMAAIAMKPVMALALTLRAWSRSSSAWRCCSSPYSLRWRCSGSSPSPQTRPPMRSRAAGAPAEPAMPSTTPPPEWATC